LNTNANNIDRVRVASILVEDLAKIGLKVTSEPLDFNALVEKIRHTYDYDAIILGTGSAVPPVPMLSDNVYLSYGITHYWFPNQDPKKPPSYDWEQKVNDLMFQIKKTEKYDEIKKLYDEV